MKIYNKYDYKSVNRLIALFCTIACFVGCSSDSLAEVSDDREEIKLDIPDRFMVKSGNEVELELSGSIDNASFEWILGDKVISKEYKVRFTPQSVGEKNLIVNVKEESGNTKVFRKTIFVAKNQKYQVVGYYPSYRANYTCKKWDKLTHVVFSSARVNEDGSLVDAEVKKLVLKEIQTAHENGVPALLSILHLSGQKELFGKAILNKKSRDILVSNCLKLVADLNLDGLDVDFEDWDSTTALAKDKVAALTIFCKDLRAGLAKSRLLTAALTPLIIQRGLYPSEMIDCLDYVNVMCYDYYKEGGNHAPYNKYVEWIESSMQQYPKNKILPGLPFYGAYYPNGSVSEVEQITYKTVLERYPGAENKNEIEGEHIYYNGKGMIKQKCDYVLENKVGGVMIWEITQDTDDANTSLLNVVDSTIKSAQ